MDIFYKDTFARIPGQKQQRILDAAIAEFAANGFAGANINRIARQAGISIGAMYKYFRSKEDLYLTIIERAHHLLADVLKERPTVPVVAKALGNFQEETWATLEAAGVTVIKDVETERAVEEALRKAEGGPSIRRSRSGYSG